MTPTLATKVTVLLVGGVADGRRIEVLRGLQVTEMPAPRGVQRYRPTGYFIDGIEVWEADGTR